MGKSVQNQNKKIGFKSVAYAVPESAGKVQITLVKKVVNEEISVGIRTIEGSAKAPDYFNHFNEIITMGPSKTEHVIEIDIIDNQEW